MGFDVPARRADHHFEVSFLQLPSMLARIVDRKISVFEIKLHSLTLARLKSYLFESFQLLWRLSRLFREANVQLNDLFSEEMADVSYIHRDGLIAHFKGACVVLEIRVREAVSEGVSWRFVLHVVHSVPDLKAL